MIRLVLVGGMLLVCARELWVYRFRSHDGEHVFLAIWAILVAAFLSARVLHMSSAEPTTILWSIRIQFALGLALVPHSLWMVRSFVRLPRSPGFLIALVATFTPALVALIPGFGFEEELVARRPMLGPEVWTLVAKPSLAMAFVTTTGALAYIRSSTNRAS